VVGLLSLFTTAEPCAVGEVAAVLTVRASAMADSRDGELNKLSAVFAAQTKRTSSCFCGGERHGTGVCLLFELPLPEVTTATLILQHQRHTPTTSAVPQNYCYTVGDIDGDSQDISLIQLLGANGHKFTLRSCL
jgi:hypothetical protein